MCVHIYARFSCDVDGNCRTLLSLERTSVMEGLSEAEFASLCEIYDADRREMERLVTDYESSSPMEDKENEEKESASTAVQAPARHLCKNSKTYGIMRRLRAENEVRIRLARQADDRLKVFFRQNETTGAYFAQFADFSLSKEMRNLGPKDYLEFSHQVCFIILTCVYYKH